MVQRVIGIDEVGRGCWAGPLVVGAVLLNTSVTGLKDSKQLTAKKRQELVNDISRSAGYIGLGWVWPEEIDQIGLTQATKLGIERALEGCPKYTMIIIDGSYNYLPKNPKTRTMIKADSTVPCVSAASIVAKEARDNYMRQQALRYPHYGFDTHVGYGTKIHITALRQHGITSIHRKSYKPIELIAGLK